MKELNPERKSRQMHHERNSTQILLPAILVVLAGCLSCTSSDNFVIGNNFVESQTDITIIDTFKVNLSTVLMDSVETSSSKIAFVGSYKDKIFGSIRSAGYFEPGYTQFEPVENAVFDSASVTLFYSGDSYGDTTSLMSVSLHQLTELITLDDNGYLYNVSEFIYSDEVIGRKTFYPEPGSTDTLRMAVNEFGRKLFDLFEDNDHDVSSSALLLQYLKGFVLVADGGNENSIIGFKADNSQTFLRIYYHVDGVSIIKSVYSLPFGSNTKQFNSVKFDFAGSELENVKVKSEEIPVSETGNNAYFHSLIGLLPKIRFPSLQDIMLEDRWEVLKAELIFEPVKDSYEEFALPDKLYLYDTDKYNTFGSALTDAGGTKISSTLVYDELYKNDTRYGIDITSFINSELSDKYFDGEHGLFIGMSGTDIQASLHRLAIDGLNHPVTLKLYYLSY
jgi:hypothetical protein